MVIEEEKPENQGDSIPTPETDPEDEPVELSIEMPRRTFKSLKLLAEIMGIKDKDWSAKFVQDSFRITEWIIYQQLINRQIIGLEPPEVKLITTSDQVDGTRPKLVRFIELGKEELAAKYFTDILPAGSTPPEELLQLTNQG